MPCKQRKRHTLKRKRHTLKSQAVLKSQIVTDAKGEALSIKPGHPGPKSDKDAPRREPGGHRIPAGGAAADLGYVGVPEMLLPHKGTNHKRVYVEHGVRRVKAWRILRNERAGGKTTSVWPVSAHYTRRQRLV